MECDNHLAADTGDVRSGGKERAYEQQTVEAESERLGVGVSTTYQVIQYQRDLTSARSAEV